MVIVILRNIDVNFYGQTFSCYVFVIKYCAGRGRPRHDLLGLRSGVALICLLPMGIHVFLLTSLRTTSVLYHWHFAGNVSELLNKNYQSVTDISKIDDLLNDWNNECPCNEAGTVSGQCTDLNRIRIGVAVMRKTNIQEWVKSIWYDKLILCYS